MVGFPRRTRPTSHQRERTILTQSGGPQSGQGSTADARSPKPTMRQVAVLPASTTPNSFPRLVAYQSVPVAALTGSAGNYGLPFGWSLLVDEGGEDIQLGPFSGYDGVFVFSAGLYAVNLTMYPRVTTASNSMMLQVGCNCAELENTPTATWHGDDKVSGNTPFATGSLTNYFDGRGLSGGVYPYLLYANLDASTTDVAVNVEVVKVA